LITLINLRGIRDAGLVFMAPTYLFAGTLLAAILMGLFKTFLSGGHPMPAEPLPPISRAAALPSTWSILQAFASGCTAMTGVEAVSNGVKAFREPVVAAARRTLTIIIALLMVLLAGIAYLVRAYGIQATAPGRPGYQSVLSLLLAAVAGKGLFYYVAMASILIVLALSANTAFADFPRLCRAIAQNNYLPHAFVYRGRRLVYTYGIVVLALLTCFLLVVFGGVTDKLIPLYAVGAFLAFTLSQFGMVAHWRKKRGPHWLKSAVVNGLGGFVTGVTVIVVLVAKFSEGAWITIIFIPLLIFLFRIVRRHYHMIRVAASSIAPVVPGYHSAPPIAVVPVDHWSSICKQAIEFASRLSPEIIGIHVEPGWHSELLHAEWERYVEQPFRAAGAQPPKLTTLPSPYRFIIVPLVQYILELSEKHRDRHIVVVIPELVEDRWYEYFLHNQRP